MSFFVCVYNSLFNKEICFYGDSRTGFVDCTPSPKQNESLIVLISLQQLNQRPNQSN